MAVSHSRHTRFRDIVRKGKPQGDVDRNGKGVFNDNKVNIKDTDKLLYIIGEFPLYLVYFVRDFLRPDKVVKHEFINARYVRMLEMGLKGKQRPVFRPVQFSGKIITMVTHIFQHFSPFPNLKRYTVRACNSCGNETDIPCFRYSLSYIHSSPLPNLLAAEPRHLWLQPLLSLEIAQHDHADGYDNAPDQRVSPRPF